MKNFRKSLEYETSKVLTFKGKEVTEGGGYSVSGIPLIAFDRKEGDVPVFARLLDTRGTVEVTYEKGV